MDTVPREALHRFPGLSPAGHERLRWLQEQPHAPRFNHLGVDRLGPGGVERVAAFEAALRAEPRGWPPGQVPVWLEALVDFCWREVPAYRALGPKPLSFFDIPPTERADLSRAPWDFVPDSQPLDGLTVYQTSGATGHPLDVITHPDVLAHYLPLLRAALAVHGVNLPLAPPAGPGVAVAVAVVCHQAATYTYAAVSTYLRESGLIKVNLHPADWRDPADRARFLDACQPLVYSGDPVSLAELAALPLAARPLAMLSTSMTLLPGLQRHLAERFGCPVIDVYSMNETGPIAVAAPEGAPDLGAHRLLSHRLYVEILDPSGAPCPPGERGEITLSGGINPFLPLLRYRSGDWASLDLSDPGQARLLGLEGRPPVVFHAVDGRPINNIDVTAALKPLALPQFALHQSADGALTLRLAAAAVDASAARAALLRLFGAQQPLSIEAFDPAAQGKLLQYTRAGG